MSYIFLDESGDLGFKFSRKRTSKSFIITFLFCDNKKPIEKCVKSIYGILKHGGGKLPSSLHACKEKRVTRIRMLKKIASKNCFIMAIYLDKTKVYTELKNEKSVLYNYVVNILLDRVLSRKLIPVKKGVTLIASRKETNKFLNQNFKNYITNQSNLNHKIDIKVEVKSPAGEKCLQVVDFISWSFFRKYEYGDSSYVDLIRNLIVEEKSLYG